MKKILYATKIDDKIITWEIAIGTADVDFPKMLNVEYIEKSA